MRARVLSAILCVGSLCAFPEPASSAVISYTAVDVSDVTVGEDLWRYDYAVSGASFGSFEGFSLRFDPALYGALEDPPVSPSGDWFVSVVQPDAGLPADGIYNALALVDGASLADVFSVSFVWLGTGTPGAQAFELYDDSFSVTETGRTRAPGVSVPEPAAVLLLGFCVLGLAGARFGFGSREVVSSTSPRETAVGDGVRSSGRASWGSSGGVVS